MTQRLEKRIQFIKLFIVFMIAFIVLKGIYRTIFPSKNHALDSLPVTVQLPERLGITEYVTQTGTTVAYQAVNLVARVEGYLQAIEFTDGSFVKKDKPLFVIEPLSYLEKLKEAKAQVAMQRASYAYSKAEYERQKRLYTQKATSLNNVEKWAARTQEYEAGIEGAVANEAVANLNYSYTHVLAPFDGRIGRHLIDIGNLVGNGKATNLATLEQIDPIYVYFNLNELDFIKIRAAATASGIKPSEISQVPVFVRMQNEKGYPHEGRLNFVSTGLDASTGTIEFRALLKNKTYHLLPGAFVQVRIPIGNPVPQLCVPDQAVQYDQVGPYLMLVDKDNKVVQKRVTLGGVEGEMRAVTEGLGEKDRVVVLGLQNAIPGNLVNPMLKP